MSKGVKGDAGFTIFTWVLICISVICIILIGLFLWYGAVIYSPYSGTYGFKEYRVFSESMVEDFDAIDHIGFTYEGREAHLAFYIKGEIDHEKMDEIFTKGRTFFVEEDVIEQIDKSQMYIDFYSCDTSQLLMEYCAYMYGAFTIRDSVLEEIKLIHNDYFFDNFQTWFYRSDDQEKWRVYGAEAKQ